jgi:surface polysaccharide O-acyltransferase-like enzyme
MARKQYMSIHFMRIMACLMVILIHISATPVVSLTPNSSAQIFFVIINQIAKPAVPIFIFISGFLLHSIYRGKPLSPLTYWMKRLPKLFFPYILWSLGYYLIYMKMGYYPFDLSFILKGLLLGTFIYHLYFMVIIIQFYVLYPLLHYVVTKIGENLTFIGILMIQIGLITVPFEWRDRLFITYFSYFGLGILMSVHLPNLIKLYKPYIMHFIAFIIVGGLNSLLFFNGQNGWVAMPSVINSLFYVVFSITSIVALLFAFEGLSARQGLKDQTRLRIGKLGDATQLIYYAHPLFILGSEFVMNQMGVLSISVRALSAFLTILFLLVPSAYWVKTKLIKLKVS